MVFLNLMLISGMELYSIFLLFKAGMNLAPKAKTNQRSHDLFEVVVSSDKGQSLCVPGNNIPGTYLSEANVRRWLMFMHVCSVLPRISIMQSVACSKRVKTIENALNQMKNQQTPQWSLGFKCFKIIIHKQIALEQLCPLFYDVTSRTLRLRAAASLLTGERRSCGHSLLARPLPRTHAHNKKITTARFHVSTRGEDSQIPTAN